MTDPAPKGDTSRLTRRVALAAGVAALAGGAVFAARWFNIGAEVTGQALSVAEAYAQARKGDIWLIDIRRPDEWARTGIGEGAVPLDMRREDFTERLTQITAAAPDRPIALICARGVRSRHMAARLAQAGFDNVLDVPEGMLGSGAGPGWLRAGLPVVGS